jgi:hypothetical protein
MAIDGETTLLTRRGKAKCTNTDTAMHTTSSAAKLFVSRIMAGRKETERGQSRRE